jgi:hypothetical protein
MDDSFLYNKYKHRIMELEEDASFKVKYISSFPTTESYYAIVHAGCRYHLFHAA